MCAVTISKLTRNDRQNVTSVNAFVKFAKLFQRMVVMFMPFMSQNIVATAIQTGTAENSKNPTSGKEANTVPRISSCILVCRFGFFP